MSMLGRFARPALTAAALLSMATAARAQPQSQASDLTPRRIEGAADRNQLVTLELANILIQQVNDKRKNGWDYAKIESELIAFRDRLEKFELGPLEMLEIVATLSQNGYSFTSLSDLQGIIAPPASCAERTPPIEKYALLRKAELQDARPNGGPEDHQRIRQAYVDRCLVSASFDLVLRDIRQVSAFEKALAIGAALAGR